jgi:segregation and condensation protein A
MDFKEFLPKEEAQEIETIEETTTSEVIKISPNQVYDIISSKKPDWQGIIYDLINTEQLDPWDIDLVILTQKYFQKIEELEETDFYISSKILLAAALLLRIKSEFLLNKHIKSIDEVLFGKKEQSKPEIERIDFDEEDLPILMPRTPLSRHRKVTLPELMAALNKAMNTESRRIKREVAIKRAHKLSHVDIPKFKTVDLKDRIKQFYARVLTSLKPQKQEQMDKIEYTNIVGKEKEEKLACFLPLLHLSNTKKLWLEQSGHLDEIWVFLYQYFEKNRETFIQDLEKDIEEMKQELEKDEAQSKNPLENIEKSKSGLEKAREKLESKKKLEEEMKKELESELGIELNPEDANQESQLASEIIDEVKEIDKEKKIEDATGFADEQ